MGKSRAMPVVGQGKGKKKNADETKSTTTVNAVAEVSDAIEPLPPGTVLLVNLDDEKIAMLAGLSRLGVKLVECAPRRLRGKLAYSNPKSTIIVVGYLDEGTPNGNQCVKDLQSAFPLFFEKVLRVSNQTDLRPRSDFYYRRVVSPNLLTVAEAIREMFKAN